MNKSLFSAFRRKRVITFLVFSVLFLQVVLVPTATGPAVIQADYGTAKELEAFFVDVNERNDQVDEIVVNELNFLRSLHEGNELDFSLLDNREILLNSKNENDNVNATVDYETVSYNFSERGLVPFEVNDPNPVKADIIETMLDESDFYQESFLGTAASLFTDTYLIYWAYDANGNGVIEIGGCGDSPLPGEPCEEGVENANLIATIWGASTAIISAWFEQFGLDGIAAGLVSALLNGIDQSDTSWETIDVNEDGVNDIRVRLVPVINDIINDETDLNPINGDVGLEANIIHKCLHSGFGWTVVRMRVCSVRRHAELHALRE